MMVVSNYSESTLLIKEQTVCETHIGLVSNFAIVFPGIGVPAVALSGSSAANAMVSPFSQWQCLDALKAKEII